MEIFTFKNKRLNRKDKLEKLNRILSIQISSFTLLILSFFVEFILLVFAALGLLFMFYLIYVLWYERKTGWIVSFFLMVPSLYFLTYIDFGIEFINKAVPFAPLVTFFLYCFLLKIALADWIKDRRWRKIREIEVQNKLELERELKRKQENGIETDELPAEA